jgi:hypothetical protein
MFQSRTADVRYGEVSGGSRRDSGLGIRDSERSARHLSFATRHNFPTSDLGLAFPPQLPVPSPQPLLFRPRTPDFGLSASRRQGGADNFLQVIRTQTAPLMNPIREAETHRRRSAAEPQREACHGRPGHARAREGRPVARREAPAPLARAERRSTLRRTSC